MGTCLTILANFFNLQFVKWHTCPTGFRVRLIRGKSNRVQLHTPTKNRTQPGLSYDKFTCLQFWASHTCTHILTHTHTYTQQAPLMPHLINTSVEKCKTNFMSSSKFIDILKCEQTIRSMDAATYGQLFIPVINFVVWIDLCIRFTIHYTIESAQFIS